MGTKKYEIDLIKLKEICSPEVFADLILKLRISKALENLLLKDTAREIVTTLKDEEMTIDEDSDMRISQEVLNEERYKPNSQGEDPKGIAESILNKPEVKKPIEKEQEIPKPDSSAKYDWWNVKDGKVRHCNDCQLFLKYDKDTGKYVHGKVDFDKRIWYFVSLKCERYGE